MKPVVTESYIPLSGELKIALGSIVTPSARDLARARGVHLTEVPPDQMPASAPPEKTLAIGADHGGFEMKESLKPVVAALGFTLRDVGVHEPRPADYPDCL